MLVPLISVYLYSLPINSFYSELHTVQSSWYPNGDFCMIIFVIIIIIAAICQRDWPLHCSLLATLDHNWYSRYAWGVGKRRFCFRSPAALQTVSHSTVATIELNLKSIVICVHCTLLRKQTRIELSPFRRFVTGCVIRGNERFFTRLGMFKWWTIRFYFKFLFVVHWFSSSQVY